MDHENAALAGLLSICAKAGALSSGEGSVEADVKKRKACLVLLSADAAYRTVKKFTDKGSFYKVPVRKVPLGKEKLGRAIGKSDRSCVAVRNQGLANSLLRQLGASGSEEENGIG